jgi:hypothetical protein
MSSALNPSADDRKSNRSGVRQEILKFQLSGDKRGQAGNTENGIRVRDLGEALGVDASGVSKRRESVRSRGLSSGPPGEVGKEYTIFVGHTIVNFSISCLTPVT